MAEGQKLARRRRMAKAIERAQKRLTRAVSILMVAKLDLSRAGVTAKKRK